MLCVKCNILNDSANNYCERCGGVLQVSIIVPKVLGSTVPQVTSFLEKFVPALSGSNQENKTFSSNLWDYLDEDYHLHLFPDLPNRDDRKQIQGDEKRSKIWNYFFRIDPDVLTKPHKEQISLANETKTALKLKFSKNIQSKVSSFKNKTERISSLLDESTRTQISAIVIKSDIDTAFVLNNIIPSIEKVQIPINDEYSKLTKITLYGQPKKQLDLVDLFKVCTNEIPLLLESLYDAAVIYNQSDLELDKYIKNLENIIETLKSQIPNPPSDTEIASILENDIKEIQRNCLLKTKLGDHLRKISTYDEEGQETIVSNPFLFILPGELQDPVQLPTRYTPPQSNYIEVMSKNISSSIANIPYIKGLSRYIHSKPTPNLLKHLIAKKEANLASGFNIFHGVYYIEFVIISDNMMTLYELFFDFINGKVTNEKIIEIYYRDIIAIEQSSEYRSIPLNINEQDEIIEIEEAPVFNLYLPSGDRRTITFVNHAYLSAISERVTKNHPDLIEDIRSYIDISVDQTATQASAVLNVLRAYLRKHKGLNTT